MMDFKPIHVLLLIIVLSVSGTWGALKTFAERPYAEKTRDMVVEMDDKGELKYWQSREWEIRKHCMNLKTKEWLCSDDDWDEYDGILVEILLLKDKLGIGGS
jgi:hypothetical protein